MMRSQKSAAPLVIAIGSTNPQKVGATEAVFGKTSFRAQVIAIAVPSGVPVQPTGRDETIRGAEHRAYTALLQANADMGVGLESGIELLPGIGWFVCDYAVVVTRDDFKSIGGGTNLPLPTILAERILQGCELGDVVDASIGIENSKTKGGVAHFLTDGLINRQVVFELALACALAPVLTPEFYREQSIWRKLA
jgi:inosine/xanthosine triphosphatase